MSFVFRYFKDDYGLDTTIGIIVFVSCCIALFIAGFALMLSDNYEYSSLRRKFTYNFVWLVLLSLLFSSYLSSGTRNISLYGTDRQKATMKRCLENQGYANSVTLDDIDYVMRTCQADEDNQRLRDSIFK